MKKTIIAYLAPLGLILSATSFATDGHPIEWPDSPIKNQTIKFQIKIHALSPNQKFIASSFEGDGKYNILLPSKSSIFFQGGSQTVDWGIPSSTEIQNLVYKYDSRSNPTFPLITLTFTADAPNNPDVVCIYEIKATGPMITINQIQNTGNYCYLNGAGDTYVFGTI